MNIGVDFDGVITDAEELKVQWVRDNLGMEVAPEQLFHKKTSVIGVEAYVRMCSDIYAGELALQNKIRPEAIVVLESFKSRGDAVHIITARINSQAVRARQLLAIHKVPHDGFHNTEETPKVEICRQLDIRAFIDDAQSTLLELAAIQGIRLIFFNVYGEKPAHGIASATSWSEVERFVCGMR